MRTRHRIPSIFNLSMVDVLCCALGCVILLWLLNLREAKQKAAQAGKSDEQVAALKHDLDGARAEMADLSGKYLAAQAELAESERRAASLRNQLAAAESEARTTADLLKKARADHESAAARAGRLEKDLAALRADKAAVDDALAKRSRDADDLEKKRAAAADRIATLEGDLRERNVAATAAARRADDLAAKVKDAEARAKDYRDKLAAEEALAGKLEKEVSKRLRGMEDAEKSLADLRAAHGGLERDLDQTRKDLTAARRSAAVLEEEKKGLVAAAERERVAADNRFAGIQLTGRRVVFLVDMSGSMEYVDEQTKAPEKWSGVRETLTKIMRSLRLEKFQVILFSDTVRYLFDGEEGWITYDDRSAARVTEAMAKVKPKGGTNMYGAFEAAFRFRAQGMDTVYLLSDGLPNMGEGLTEQQAKLLKETEQGEILGKYVRRKLLNDWNRTIRGQGRVRVNAVGFFYESPDVGAFLWSLTRENDGGFVGMSKP
jgi:predicted  nucleic acid-binding Zn-ribbon protein